jgi:hypothetical protein
MGFSASVYCLSGISTAVLDRLYGALFGSALFIQLKKCTGKCCPNFMALHGHLTAFASWYAHFFPESSH